MTLRSAPSVSASAVPTHSSCRCWLTITFFEVSARFDRELLALAARAR